ncbi:SPOR domain-containing protein [Treponema zioleckii]|uniref:SPOR domain-containing protein n=1 Tax=Treponema zioleckii TaxID=331680 RepID=UPI00168A828C|nr:SPOR domain-containing protein [Treponema zioleckii]
MESKRTLWIIVAAGTFLLVVVGLAVILSGPSTQQQKAQGQHASLDARSGWITTHDSEPTVNDPISSNSFMNVEESLAANTESEKAAEPFEQISNPFSDSSIQTQVVQQQTETQNPNGFSPLRTENVTVIADNTTIISQDTTKIDLNALKNPSASSNVTAKNELTESQINTAKQTQLAHADSTPAKVVTPVEVKPVAKKAEPQKALASAKPAEKKIEKKDVSKNTSIASTKKAVNDSAKVSQKQDKFWVQVAAFSNIDNAKAARSTLEANKIQCDIFTTNSNGKNLYRVQSGPYTTRNEAEHWGNLIGKIDKFSGTKSMILKND